MFGDMFESVLKRKGDNVDYLEANSINMCSLQQTPISIQGENAMN